MLLPAICLSVFDHFVGLTLKGLSDTDRKFTVAAIPRYSSMLLCSYKLISFRSNYYDHIFRTLSNTKTFCKNRIAKIY